MPFSNRYDVRICCYHHTPVRPFPTDRLIGGAAAAPHNVNMYWSSADQVVTMLCRAALLSAVGKLQPLLQQLQQDSIHSTADLIHDGMTIMTLSLSSTIVKGITMAAERSAASNGKGLSAIVCESRPLYEGVTLAQRIASVGVNTTVITDAQAAVFVSQADVVLIGADSITAEGVVNKVGSHLLALAAKAKGVPVYAVADTMKVTPGAVVSVTLPHTKLHQQSEEEKDVSEVIHDWPSQAHAVAVAQDKPNGSSTSSPTEEARFHVRNVYFELTPLDLITGVITEKGMLTAQQIQQLVEERRQQYIKAFHVAVPDS